jgi:hypothetical protein
MVGICRAFRITAFGIYHGASVMFHNFDVRGGGRAPQLDAICPDGFDSDFIDKEHFV